MFVTNVGFVQFQVVNKRLLGHFEVPNLARQAAIVHSNVVKIHIKCLVRHKAGAQKRNITLDKTKFEKF